jgi:hypothetical protein
MPVEGDDGRGEPVARGDGTQVGDDAAVARVHAVELADGDGAGPEAIGHGREVVEEEHDQAAVASACTRPGRRTRSQSMPSTGSTSGTNA